MASGVSQNMHSCIYRGWVRHRRLAPVEHAFDYRVFMVHLDLAELDDVFRGRWLWSTRRPAPAWFRRKDHFGDSNRPLRICIEDLVESEVGRRPTGPIRLLTHLRYFGYCINPVSFYYCWNAEDREVDAIVAEVHNTPWGERHCYVLDAAAAPGPARRFRFPKAFHVSPFMGMDQHYDWRFRDPGDRLSVHMVNEEGGTPMFDATLALSRTPMTGATLARTLCRHPWMTASVLGGIYTQAFHLWRKRTPFHAHPRTAAKDADA